jgi:branched-chain amino acid transport system ATP-binding protein
MSTVTQTATCEEALLVVRNLDAWYGAAHILHAVNLQVQRGQVLALMGRNGAGKSTTLKSIMGLVPQRAGAMQFMGRDIARLLPYQCARLGLGYVPEDRRLFSELTVLENLETGRQPARFWPDGTAALSWSVEDVFDLFPPLAAMRTRAAGAMSGGEQQMLAVARTLMGNPFLLLLDEPSEGVAPLIVEQMAQMILNLKARGISILLSEQNIHFAQWVSDQVCVLEKGVVRFSGPMTQLDAEPGIKRDYLAI